MSQTGTSSPKAWAFLPQWWSLAAVVVGGGLVFWRLQSYPAFAWTGLEERGGLVLAGIIFAFLGVQILWWFSERRGGVFNATFLGLAAIFWLGALIWAREVQLRHDTEVADQLAAARKEMERAARERGRASARMASVDLPEDRFLRYSAQITHAEVRALQDLDREMIQGLWRAMDRLSEASEVIAEGTADRWRTAETRSELRVLREAYGRVYEATRALIDLSETFSERYEARLAELELGERARRIAVAEMERILQDREFVLMSRLYRLEADAIEMLMQALEILESNWEAWEFDRKLGRLSFDRAEVEWAFFYALNEADESLARIRETRDELSRPQR